MNERDPANWSDGPRPSFFGQLSRTQPEPAGDASTESTIAAGETIWADPLEAQDAGDDEDGHRERETYVSNQFGDSFASGYGERQLLAFVVTLAITAICWSHVARLPLVAWLTARVLLTATHVVVTLRHGKRAPVDAQAQSRYARRVVILAILNGAVFGASVLLFLGNIPIGLQFACWLILAGAMTLPTHSLAFNPTRLRVYINSTFAVAIGCVLYRIFTSHAGLSDDVQVQHYEPWFLVFPFTLWFLILYIAKRVYASAREGFEVGFYKQALIDALAAKRYLAEEALQVKNRFIATAAHDMRQPVMALSLYTEHLREVPTDQPIVLPKITRAAAAINQLFDSLFDLARMDNEQLNLRLETLDVAEVMHDLRDQFEPVAIAKGVGLKMRTTHGALLTDPVLVRRLIGNIVSNAIKYTEPGNKVLMAARVRAGSVTVEIIDQGEGIASNELDKIFLEFYKIGGPTANPDGFGLGLSIVARLSHALNAKVQVRSRVGRGTTFRLSFRGPSAHWPPASAQPTSEGVFASPPAPPGSVGGLL